MNKFLRRKVNIIFLMLGHECNLNCEYCLQHGITEEPLSHEINSDIYDFIEEMSEGNNFHIQFYGGEPLLFWKDIQNVVAELEIRYLPIRCSIITNGKLLTEDIVDFCNKHGINISISWDGPNVLQTRGYDVIQDKHDLLLKVKRLCISSVISAKNYPLEILDAQQRFLEDYMTVNKKVFNLNCDLIFNTGVVPKNLLEFDWARLEQEIRELTKRYLSKMTKDISMDHAHFEFINDIYQRVKKYYQDTNVYESEQNRTTCCCGNGYTVLNLGLNGSLYICHNSSQKAGHIKDNYHDYILKVMAADPTKENMQYCKDCFALPYCNAGCKLVKDRKLYCKLRQTIYKAFTDELIKAGVKDA